MSISRRKAAAQLLGAGAATLLGSQEASAQSVTQYFYDAFGRLGQVTHPNGQSVAYNYDAAGNRTSITRPSAAPSFISAGAGADISGSSSLSVPYPSGLQSGDTILLHVMVGAAISLPTITTPSGFTLAQTGISDDTMWVDLGPYGGSFPVWIALRMSVFKKTASGSESGSLSVSFSDASGVYVARMYRCQGGGNTEGGAVGSSNSYVLPSITTTGNNRRILQFMATFGSGAFYVYGLDQPVSAYSSANGTIGIASAPLPLPGTLGPNTFSGGGINLVGSLGFAMYA